MTTEKTQITLDQLYTELLGIKQALIGNHLTNDGGLVARVDDLEEENKILKTELSDLRNSYKNDVRLITVIGGLLFALPNIINAISALQKLFVK